MRERMCRGKNFTGGSVVYGYYLAIDDEISLGWYPAGSHIFQSIRIDPFTLEESTGFKDKMGNEIFTYDVVMVNDIEYLVCFGQYSIDLCTLERNFRIPNYGFYVTPLKDEIGETFSLLCMGIGEFSITDCTLVRRSL